MIDRMLGRCAGALAALGGLGLMLMMVQTVADVLATNFAGSPIPGNLEVISVYHMVLVVFLPLAFVELRHEHIQVDLLFRVLPRPAQRGVLVFGYLISAVFFAILASQTALDAFAAWEKNEIMMGAVWVTIWPAKIALPLGFAAICAATLRHAWRACVDPGFSPDPPEAGAAGHEGEEARHG